MTSIAFNADPVSLTTKQAAYLLGVSSARTIQLAREGRLAHYWTPHGRLYPRREVERLAAERAARARLT